MANVVSTIKAHMGDTPYFITRMSMRELVQSARPPKEFDNWVGMSIDERMQRDPDLTRVNRDIVPYLKDNEHRFFGAFIVVVEPGNLEFESLQSLVPNLPRAYRDEAGEAGFLTLTSKDNVILDGQHRWYAADAALKDPKSAADEIGSDEVTVLFIENTDPKKTRGIFNKINRYAKPTGRSDNILTSEDDGYAIVTRMLVNPEPESDLQELPPGPLADRKETKTDGTELTIAPVQWRSTSLSKTMKNLTTISALADNVQTIVDFNDKLRPRSENAVRRGVTRPPEELIVADYLLVVDWFNTLLTELDAYREGLKDLGSLAYRTESANRVPGRRFDDEDKHTLLFRPVGQVVLVKALVRALELSQIPPDSQPRLNLRDLIARVNKVDFSMPTGSMWHGTIVSPDGRMIARKEGIRNASDLLAYMIAPEYFNSELRQKLWADWNKWQGRDVDTPQEELRAEGLDALVPKPLPKPIDVDR